MDPFENPPAFDAQGNPILNVPPLVPPAPQPGPAPQGPAPAPQTAPTLAELTTLVGRLLQSQQALVNTVNHLATRSNDNRPAKSAVEKPAVFKGKDSESARMFRAAVWVYIVNNRDIFAIRDLNGKILYNANRRWEQDVGAAVAFALSLMADDAALWARPHMESLAQNKVPFATWADFITAFQGKFEPVDAVTEAKAKVQAIKQGKRTFNELLADFETWSGRTGWTKPDLYDRLKQCLNDTYRDRLSYFEVPPTDYDTLVDKCRAIDRALLERSAQKGKIPEHNSTTSSAFRDPDAMDIDATSFDSVFNGLQGNRKAIRDKFQEFIKGKCVVCGSSGHTNTPGRHDKVTCNHCGKNGHYASICLGRIFGNARSAPRTQQVRATDTSANTTATPASASISAVDTEEPESEITALKKALDEQQKKLDELHASINANF